MKRIYFNKTCAANAVFQFIKTFPKTGRAAESDEYILIIIFTNMTEQHKLIEDILKQHRHSLSVHYDKYRNHVYRVFNLTLLLRENEKTDTNALAVAAAFHDIGIWTADTLDYLEPSIALAKEYIKDNQLKVSAKLVERIIANHHKVTNYKEDALAEAFRKADLVDLSLGVISHGVSHREILDLYHLFPEAGFHLFIAGQVIRHSVKHPFNPLPIFKW